MIHIYVLRNEIRLRLVRVAAIFARMLVVMLLLVSVLLGETPIRLKTGFCFKGRQTTQAATACQVVEESLSRSIPVTFTEFELIQKFYLQTMASSWDVYREQLESSADPYETATQRSKRISDGLRTALLLEDRNLHSAETWLITLAVPPRRVSYDPDAQIATLELPEIDVPSISAPAKALGTYRGHQYPNMYYALEPLWTHVYLHDVVRPRHLLNGAVRVQVPLEAAKRLDIISRKGYVNAVLRFTGAYLENYLPDGGMVFPCLQLCCASWTIGSEALGCWGTGTGHQHSSFMVAGPPRVIGESPNDTVPYMFQAYDGANKLAELKREILLTLGTCIDIPNPRDVGSQHGSSGSLFISAQPSGSQLYIDGQNFGLVPRLVDSLPLGNHYVILRQEFFQPTVKEITVTADSTTDSLNLSLDQFKGNWVLVGVWEGFKVEKWPMWVSQSLARLSIQFQGNTYEAEVCGNEEFWRLNGSSTASLPAPSGKMQFRQDRCAGFNFKVPTGDSKGYDHYFFFISEDGRDVAGRIYTYGRAYVVYPGKEYEKKEGMEFFCDRRN